MNLHSLYRTVHVARLWRSTSLRTFLLCPLVVGSWEWLSNDQRLRIAPVYVPLLAWGFLQYRFAGRYRMRRGGGGPGMSTPPQRLVTTGPYAWSRNPMYLGHILFLLGLVLVFRSLLAAVITAATAVWLHGRVRRDEAGLRARFGVEYDAYCARVARWIPYLLSTGQAGRKGPPYV